MSDILQAAQDARTKAVKQHIVGNEGNLAMTEHAGGEIVINNLGWKLSGRYLLVTTEDQKDQEYWRDRITHMVAGEEEIVHILDGMGWSRFVLWQSHAQCSRELPIIELPGRVYPLVRVALHPAEDPDCKPARISEGDLDFWKVVDMGEITWVDSSGIRRSAYDHNNGIAVVKAVCRSGYNPEEVEFYGYERRGPNPFYVFKIRAMALTGEAILMKGFSSVGMVDDKEVELVTV